MSHPHDGSSIDLEKELVRYMVERRVSRRYLLERIARIGPAAALAPIIAACTSGATAAPSTSPLAATSAAPSTAPSSAPSSAASPTPVPSPEAELNVYNWTEYIGEGVLEGFTKKFGVKVNYDFFSNTNEAYAKLGDDGGGYDVSFPISVDLPSFIAKGAVIELDKSLLPNLANLGTEWANPGYDPENAHSVPYMWWTTGVAYDTAQIDEELVSSTALWNEAYKKHILMLDDYQETFATALIQQGHSANTTNTAEMDQALTLLETQKPLVRKYSTDTTVEMGSGDYWIGQVWGADIYPIQESIDTMVYYIPEEGGIRGSDTMAIFSGAKHPIAAHLFINYMLDAQVSADNTNFIGYMGPNAAAKQFISPDLLSDPAVNPDQAIVSKLEELLDLGAAVRDEYLKRWQQLRGG